MLRVCTAQASGGRAPPPLWVILTPIDSLHFFNGFWSSKRYPKWSQNDPLGGPKMIKKTLGTENCENLIFATPPMDFSDFQGPRDPLGGRRDLDIVYFSSDRNQHDFELEFAPQYGSLLSPPGSFLRLHRLPGGDPGSPFGNFGATRVPEAPFQLPGEVLWRFC